ncbi:MAG: hypothetical protein IAE81_08935 [Caldilineaceae bacterium]|jgi:hypothetical protein|nr:hypothetical protein [Caldilineaceae bacterium]
MQENLEVNEDLIDRRVHLALRHWHDRTRPEGMLVDLLLFKTAATGEQNDPRLCTNQILRQALFRLAAEQATEAALLEARFIEKTPVDHVALDLKFAESTIYSKQNQAIKHLAAIILQMENEAWRERRRRINDRVPAPAAVEPVGHDAQLDPLLSLLRQPTPPWLLSIEGIGGIGKTTLAAALLRRVAQTPHFVDFAWVSAKPAILDLGGAIRPIERPTLTAPAMVAELLTQLAPEESRGLLAFPDRALSLLRSRLRGAPHLIVIDNLETVADLEALAPTLLTLANPTKFVLTSRQRLVDESGVYLYPVPELSERDALTLVRQEGALRNLPEVANADAADLRPIFATVGGNPLALLLVVGLTHVHSLTVVLRNLREARGLPAENLYTYVYRQAWDALDERHRQVLLAMPLVATRGEPLEFVAAVCELPLAATADALYRLYQLNLVTVNGDLHARRYAIHSLTRTFLQEQVAQWL